MARVPSDLRLVPLPLAQVGISPVIEVIRQNAKEVASVVNGRISFGDGVDFDNIEGTWVSILTPASPDTDFTVTHGLDRLPVGVIPMRKAAAVDIYTGSLADTTTTVTLRATIGSVAVELFIV